MFGLDDAQLFARVVEHGGFAAASRALGRPKSTLSKRIGALEQQLGVRLLQRNARGLSLTDAGAAFHRHVCAMLIEAESAESAIRERLAEPRGTVRLTASTITSQHHLSAILPEIVEALPRVRIVLHATDRRLDLVQECFDIALRDHHDPLPSSDLVQRRIGFEPDLLVAASAYLERAGTPRATAELANHAGLMNGPVNGPAVWRLQNAEGETAEVSPRVRLACDEPVTLVNAALKGLGITALPRSICASWVERGHLTPVLLGWTAGGATTTLLIPHRRGQLPSVRAVADALVAALRVRLETD